MLKALAFGLAAGASLQAWRQWPANGPETGRGVALVFLVGIVAAYLAGRWRGHGHGSVAVATANATATATATAEARQMVNIFMPGAPNTSASGSNVPDVASVPWLDHNARGELELADLEGADLDDLGITAPSSVEQ